MRKLIYYFILYLVLFSVPVLSVQASAIPISKFALSSLYQGDEEDDEEWTLSNEDVWEELNWYTDVFTYHLYPEDDIDPDTGESYFQDEIRNIEQHPDYKSVIKWVSLRSSFRERYETLCTEIDAAYKAGQLGTKGSKGYLYDDFFELMEEMGEAHYNFTEEFKEEDDSHKYLYGGDTYVEGLRDGDLATIGLYFWSYPDPGYDDSHFYSYRGLDLTGYAISVTNNIGDYYSSYSVFPRKWELYGYYSDNEDTRAYDEIDISEYTLIDSQSNCFFPWEESVRKVFKLATPGHYNRFILRFYYTGNGNDELITLSEFELLEGNVVASDDDTTTEPEIPELPKLVVLQNETASTRFPYLRIRSNVGQPDSPFEFRNRNEAPSFVFRHVNPEYGTYKYVAPNNSYYESSKFDDNGYITLHMCNKWGVNIFELSSFPKVPNHACDVLVSYEVREKATGRVFMVNDTIPYYIKFPAPVFEQLEDSRVTGSAQTQESTFETVIEELTYADGFSIDVEISDYTGGSYATRHLTLERDEDAVLKEIPSYKDEYDARVKTYSNEWVTFTNDVGLYRYSTPVASLHIPIVCGEKDVTVKITACNKRNESSVTGTANVTYDHINVDEQLKGTYAFGINGEGAVHDIKDWILGNEEQRDAFDAALKTQNYNDILAAYDAYTQSRFRVISYSAPIEWGYAWCREGGFYLQPGDNKFYVMLPTSSEEEYSFTLDWYEVNVKKTFKLKGASFDKNKYIFRPIVEGESGDRSVTMFYQSKNSEGISSKTVVGRFGSDEENPSCVVIDEPIYDYSYLSFRDNASQASSYHNKARGADRIVDWYPGNVIRGGYNNDKITTMGYNNGWGSYFSVRAEPFVSSYKEPLGIFESTLTSSPVVRLQLLDEAGEPVTSDDVVVRTAYISQPIGEPLPIGTSTTFNPFIKGETVPASKGIDGIVDIKIPAPEPGYINHAFLEVYRNENCVYPLYNSRLISELTTPEAFSDYINKGLPYPCVLTKRKDEDKIEAVNLWVRPADAQPFSDDCVNYPVEAGTEMGYEGGEKNVIDLLVKIFYDESSLLGEGTPTALPNGTVETPWQLKHAYKLLAPRRAYVKWYFDNDQIDPANILTDKSGRNVIWNKKQTGFQRSYFYLTCEPYRLLPNMKKSDTRPASDAIVLARFDQDKLDADGKVVNRGYVNYYGNTCYYYNGLFSSPLVTAYNTAVEEVDPESYLEDMAKTATPGYDGSMVDQNDKSISKISGGLAGFNMATPGCLPFLNVLVTSEKGEYRVRSSFELNAMDFGKPAFGAWEKIKDQQQRVNDVSNYLQQFLLIKNSCIGDYTTDIFNTDDGVFVGFKGFTEMAIIKDFKENTWKPYFTGFGAKLEASAQYSWKMHAPPFIAKMITRGEVSSSFMLLNPHPEDFIYKQAALDPKQGLDTLSFNTNSHFNMYVNSTFDLSLCLQGGIGFDAGFIAAHGGLMGKARAAARFAYVNRPYLTGNLRESAGSRFDLEASLSAYAYFKFLFIKYTKEWKLCGVEKTFWKPDNDWNPLKSDPNLRPELLTAKSRVHTRSLAASYLPPRRRVSVIDSKSITDKVDIFANPIYLNGGSRLAFFNINNPNDQNDDRVLVSGEGCDVNNSSQLYGDDVPAFTYHAASAGNHQIVAVQRLGQQLADSDNTIEKASGLSKELQIVASVGDNSGAFVPTVVSTQGSANTDPKAAIAQNGNAAIVWASGDISLKKTIDDEGDTYTEPVMKGDIVVSKYDKNVLGGTWLSPVSLVHTNEDSQVKDYAIAMGGQTPLVIASIPGTNNEGEHTAPTYLMTVTPSATPGQPGTARRTSLGIQGAQHQVVAVYDNGTQETNHFIASSLVEADTVGRTDIVLYDIVVNEDGSVHYSNLGKLGLSKYRILSYRLVSPKNGATGVDGLGLIWNQHEQENTDDETLEAIAYNRTYVARINRRGDYIYLSHAAKALDLPDEENVADMTAYMDYDISRDCPVVTAAFCIGATQVEGASTAASIIEKKVSLNNEIEWLEAESGLSNIIDKKNGTEIRLAVRNIGLHTIRKFTIEMAGQTFEQEANVKPSAVTAITLKLSAKTDFSDEIPFKITADFYDVDVNNPNDMGSYTGQADLTRAFKVNVVDMCSGLTINRFDTNTKKNVVVVSVSNLSPMALKPGNTVKVSLFTDALGDTQYPGVATYSIPANQLYDATTKSAMVKTIRFFVNAPETRTTVYAICHTVDSDGNVIFDQNSSDNTVILSLAPSNTDDGSVVDGANYSIGTLVRLIQSLKTDNPQPDQDYNGDGIVDKKDIDALVDLITEAAPDRLTVEDLENPQLKVRNAGESIEVEGLNPDKDLKVFDATGQLINWTEPNADKANVKLNRKGTVIVVNDGKAGVIRH